jgi:hypothetical protein
MDVILSLYDSSLSAEDIAELSSKLQIDINQESDLSARQLETAGGIGTKGDAVTIGQIMLAALSSGTVVALFQVLQSYFERKPTLRFEIETADGGKLNIETEHLSPEQIEQTLQAVQQLCKD